MYSGMPMLESYEQLKHQFTNTTPVRGEDKSLRRYGNRKHQNKILKQYIDEELGEYYAIRLYNTELIRVFPDHYEIHLDGWGSQTTIGFLRDVLPHFLSYVPPTTFVPQGYIHPDPERTRDDEITHKYNGHYINARGRFKFSWDHQPIGDNFPKPVKYRVNRKAMAKLRESEKELRDYMKAMLKLFPSEIPRDEYYAKREAWAEEKSKANNANTTLDARYVAFMTSYFNNAVYGYKTEWQKSYYKVSYDRIVLDLEKDLKQNNPQVLEVVTKSQHRENVTTI
jgi:hypothetical protein